MKLGIRRLIQSDSTEITHHPSVFRVGVEARVRGEGARRGAVLAEVRLHRHALPLRLPQPFVRIQVGSDTNGGRTIVPPM